MKHFAFLITIACALPGPIHAETTGQSVYNNCATTDLDNVHLAHCSGYITGAWDGIRAISGHMLIQINQANGTDIALGEFIGICVPQDTPHSQLAGKFLTYLVDNTERLSQPAGALMIEAYQNAYPCP